MGRIDPRFRRGPGRRRFLSGGLFAVAAMTAQAAGMAPALSAEPGGRDLTPPEALDLALRGEAVLIDIRRPEEWARSGIAAPARPLDMRRDDFVPALLDLLGGDAGRPMILICASGVRSHHLARALREAGVPAVHDVPEGMMGSEAGPGWIRRGLPLRQVGAGAQ